MKLLRRGRDWLYEHLGRRGLVLLIFSLVFVCTGLKSILDPVDPSSQFFLYAFLPPFVRFFVWMVPAGIGIYTAFQSKRTNDAPGFSALAIPAVIQLVSYAIAAIAFCLNVGTYDTAWVRGLQWLMIVALLMVSAGWTEVDDSRTAAPPEKGDEE